jgi:hypothetical protein
MRGAAMIARICTIALIVLAYPAMRYLEALDWLAGKLPEVRGK